MKIVLNAGHGMNTSGKRTPDGMREFEFNSAVAEYMKAELLTYNGIEIKFTHDPTGKVDVRRSTRIANGKAWGNDLWVGIHANAFGNGWSDAHGIETFVAVIASNTSVELANAVQTALVKEIGLANRGVKRSNFDEVALTKCPAILIEHAFMTNREEAELLKSDAFRRKCALSNSRAIAEFFGLVKIGEPVPTPKPEVIVEQVQPQGLDIDGYLGAETIKALQRHFGTPVDGVISKPSMLVKAIQRKVGAGVDGYMGKETVSKLQAYLGTPVDGKISKPSMMIKELQRRLNEGRF